MATDSTTELYQKIRAFKRNAFRVRDGLADLGDASVLSLNISWEAGSQPQSSFEEKAPIIRLAALIRPFMADGSPIELRQFWTGLIAEPGVLDEDTMRHVGANFETAERLILPLEFNGRDLTAREIYYAYAEGEYFNDDPKASSLLESMSFLAPAADLVRYLFFNACATYARLTLLILDVILATENRLTLPEPEEPDGRCIYCPTTSGDFGPEEHVIPEAFVVDGMVLHSGVCQACNNKLSRLDQFLANDFEPLAFLRVIHVPLTKKGKFPRADFREFKFEKVKPRTLRIINKTKKDVFTGDSQPDGTFRGSLNFTPRPVDMLRVARALFKIGLGMVAYDEGVAVACERRFDAARAFVHGEAPMPNHLLILKKVQPEGAVAGAWQSFNGATGVEIRLLGMCFVINLEPTPFGIPSEVFTEHVQAFWLGEFTKHGIVRPCGAHCAHGTQSAVPV